MSVVYRCNARSSINDANAYAHVKMLEKVTVTFRIQNFVLYVVTKHKRCRYSLYIYLRINERTKNKINEDSYWKFKFWSIEREMFLEVMAQTVIRIRMTVTSHTLSITMNLSSRFITPRLKLSVNVDLFSFRSLLLDLCHCVDEEIRVFFIRFFVNCFLLSCKQRSQP